MTGGDFTNELYGEWTWNGSAFVNPSYHHVPNNTGYDLGTSELDVDASSGSITNNTLSNFVGGGSAPPAPSNNRLSLGMHLGL